MAAFKKGDRVRLVGSDDPNCKTIGVQGTFVRYEINGGYQGSPADCLVRWDGHAKLFAEGSEYLEPVLPERNQITTWAECPWQPEHLRQSEHAT